MCLTINLDAVKQIAQEDIPCYKLLKIDYSRDMLTSPYKKHPYKIDELVTATIGPVSAAMACWETRKFVREINEGLHSYTINKHVSPVPRYMGLEDAYYFKAIIPKGSEYYEGIFGGDPSYVSNQLIVKNRVVGPVWINAYV